MALISCPECGKEVSDRAPACIHCGYPLSSAAPYADFRPITGPNRFTVRLTARPAYPDARSRTLRALMKELGLSREQGIRLLEQARREPVPCGGASPRRRPLHCWRYSVGRALPSSWWMGRCRSRPSSPLRCRAMP